MVTYKDKIYLLKQINCVVLHANEDKSFTFDQKTYVLNKSLEELKNYPV